MRRVKRVILVGCSQTKALPPETEAMGWPRPRLPAKDLYVSPLFRKRRAYAEREVADGRADLWAIVSALFHTVAPDRPLPGYEFKLTDRRISERDEWGFQVAASLNRDVVMPVNERGSPECPWCEREPYVRCTGCLDGTVLEFHAGADYVAHARPHLERAGMVVETPLAGLGIGEQLHWYAVELDPQMTIEEAAA